MEACFSRGEKVIFKAVLYINISHFVSMYITEDFSELSNPLVCSSQFHSPLCMPIYYVQAITYYSEFHGLVPCGLMLAASNHL